jgi:hypothetical protein
MSVTRTPVNADPEPQEDPTSPDSTFYRDLEQHLRSRRLYEEAKDMAERFRDRVKEMVEVIGHKDDTGSYVVSFDEDESTGLSIAGHRVKFVKSERYRKVKGTIDPDKAKKLLTKDQWDKVTSHVITIEVPGHAPVDEIIASVKETLKDADIEEGVAIDPELQIVEDKVVNLNYFDGEDQISDDLMAKLFDPDEYATRLIVKKK